MTSLLSLTAAAAPLAFLAVALTARIRPDAVAELRRAGTGASVLGLVGAAVAVAAVAIDGPMQSALLGADGLGLAIRLDAVSVSMLGMIAVLALVIVRYSNTYLDGDPRQGAFLGRLAATIAAVQFLVLAGNLVLLVAAWIATSLSLHGLLVFHPERRRAVVAARKKFVVARLGDAFLLAAAVLLHGHFGTGDLGAIFAGAGAAVADGAAAVQFAAVFLAVAAVLKAAQFPLHGWLVEVMETPTPVSALLHAGILNAGPFLIIRMSPVADGSDVANGLVLAVGGATALFASSALLTQPSVKVALGYSSAAHMGFSLFVCSLGLYPAAFLHLVGHSFYKAHAFLSSGSVIDQARAPKPALPARRNHPGRLVAAGATALGLYGAFALAWGLDVAREPELLVLGLIIVLGVSQLLAVAFDGGGAEIAIRAGGLALGVTAVFFALEAGAHHVLAGVVPDATGRPTALLLAAGLVVAAFAVAIVSQVLEPGRAPSRRRTAVALHLRNGLYANAVLDRLVGALRTGDAR